MSGDKSSFLEGIASSLRGGAERKRVNQLIDDLRVIPPEERVDVPYPPRVGVVWQTGENTETFLTGAFQEQEAVDCNIVVAKGADRSGMMHVSPQTMPDEYVRRRVARPWNTDVDQQLKAMLSAIGGPGSVESVTIVGGDTTLARELSEFLAGGENVWGSDKISSPVPGERIRVVESGTDKKLVVAKPSGGTIQVAHLTRPRLEEISF